MITALFSAATSTSAIYGNVSSAIREFILLLLPRISFNYIHISTDIAYKSYKRFHGSNQKIDLKTKQRPYLFIQPEYNGNDTDLFLSGTNFVENTFGMRTGAYDQRFLFTVMRDSETGLQLRYRINHDRITYSCRIQVDTLHQAIDIYKMLRNTGSWEKTMYYRASLESVIPRSIIGYLARYCNIDIRSEDSVYAGALLARLNRLSKYPITYKMKSASQKDEFFLYYNHNLLVTLTDLSRPSQNSNGMHDGYYELGFNIIVEFNLPAVYYLETYKDEKFDLEIDLCDIDEFRDAREYIPLYTIRNLFSRFPPKIGVYSYFANARFTIDTITEEESIELLPLLQNTEEEYSIYHILLEAGLLNEAPEGYIKVILLMDDTVLEEKKDYTFDFSSLSITLTNIQIEVTYRYMIYLNMETINRKKAAYIDKNKREKSIQKE